MSTVAAAGAYILVIVVFLGWLLHEVFAWAARFLVEDVVLERARRYRDYRALFGEDPPQ